MKKIIFILFPECLLITIAFVFIFGSKEKKPDPCCKGMVVRFYSKGRYVDAIGYDSIINIPKVGCNWLDRKTGKSFWADSISIKLK